MNVLHGMVVLSLGATMALGAIPIRLSGVLPVSVDNSANTYFRAIVSQRGETCGNVAGIAYVFTYEMNAARNLSSKDINNNCYPYIYTYHFLNDGYDMDAPDDLLAVFFRMFLPAWKIVRENGIPLVKDFGGEASGFYTKWINGYDIYYKGMHNRVDQIDSLNMTGADALVTMKQWLYNHGNGSSKGGIFVVTFNVYGVQTGRIAAGAESGQTIITRCGNNMNSAHGFGLVGYNDSIRYDFNSDGRYTNTVDISGDGRVDQADWEVGAVKVAHTWGPNSWSSGFAYLPYRYLYMPALNGGIQSNNHVYFITVRPDYAPRLALKATITHEQRNQIALSVGVSGDPNASVPSKIRTFDRQFTYAGGANPMEGKAMSPTIEIGLDISDCIDSIGGAARATYFLIVDSKVTSGVVTSLSVMDYTGTSVRETPSTIPNTSIRTGKNYYGVAATLTGIAPRKGHQVSDPVRVLSHPDGTIGLYLPFKQEKVVSLFDIAGKRRFCRVASAPCERINVPQYLSGGAYIVQVRLKEGTTFAVNTRIVH